VVVGVVGTSGVANLKMGQFENFKIYPNPAEDNVTIEGAGGCEVRIFNVVGEVVYSSAGLPRSKEVINISGLADGVYTVQLVNSGGYKKNVKLLKE